MTDDPAPRLAIDGGEPLLSTPYPEAPATPPAGDLEPARALEVEFAARLAVPAALVIAFDTHAQAYDAALGALGVREGGEAIVPALCGEALAAAAQRAGLQPVPTEVDADATLAPRGLVRALSARLAVICVAHAFGHPAAVDDLEGIARDRALPLVEDASDALGAALRGVPAGRLGAAAVFAFGPGHVLTGGAGERPGRGALLVVAEAAAAGRARLLHASSSAALDPEIAAIALAELRASDEVLAARRRMAWELTFNVRGMRGLAGMPHGRWVHHGYDRYVVRLRGILWKRSLADTVAAIRAEGVPCEAACGPPLHLDAAIRAALPGDERLAADHFPVAARLSEELIAIPLHAALTSRDMDAVAAVLRKVEWWSR